MRLSAHERERTQKAFYRWLKETNQTPSLRKPQGELPKSAIDHMRMIPYPEVIKNVRSDDKS